MVMLVLLLLYLRVERRYVQKAQEFETSLKQNVDPEELRQWAITFMREHPQTFGDVVTNAPQSICRVAGTPPHVTVFESYDGSGASIMLGWLRTDPSVQIGTTNFLVPTNSKVTMWRKGIYIVMPTKR
jgi:hypothetical protein